jgi:hypothetical protein
MEYDFHYYAVAVLARAAGFAPSDALTIAYACQYVDNATESAPFHVGGFLFEPVRTAHEGLKVYNWAIQKRVYIPFHFLPARMFNPAEPPDPHFETKPDSPFANAVLDDALAEPDGLYRLCRIGIALHAFADTWAHQRFSGKKDVYNAISHIRHRVAGEWKTPFFQNLFHRFLPLVGHSRAAHDPDLSHLSWSYTQPRRTAEGGRCFSLDNARIFYHAAERIHEKLSAADKPGGGAPPVPWPEISRTILRLLREDSELPSDCAGWKRAFGPLFEGRHYQYDKYRWRIEALGDVETIRWDHKSRSARRLWFKLRKGFFDSAWVQFHRAARKQRYFVLERVV